MAQVITFLSNFIEITLNKKTKQPNNTYLCIDMYLYE